MSVSRVRKPKVEVTELDGLITISLAAVLLGVSRQGAHRMVDSGRLSAWRIRSAGNDRPLVVMEDEVMALREKTMQQVVDVA